MDQLYSKPSAPKAAPVAKKSKGFFLHIDGDEIPMEGMDTADDGFLQTRQREGTEEGAFISLSMEASVTSN